MQQAWNIKSRAHTCARTERPFEEGEIFHTAIYFDGQSGEFIRRDVSQQVWEEEIAERTPFSSWKAEYSKPESSNKPKAEISSKEGAEELLRRLSEEDESYTINARYILALMLERKKQLVQKEIKYVEDGSLLIYELKRSGEVFIIRDPELRLDEIEAVQEEVAVLLGLGMPGENAPAAPMARSATVETAPAPESEDPAVSEAATEDSTPASETHSESPAEAATEAETDAEPGFPPDSASPAEPTNPKQGEPLA